MALIWFLFQVEASYCLVPLTKSIPESEIYEIFNHSNIQTLNYFIYQFCTVDKESKVPEIPCTFTFTYSSSLLLVQLSSCLSLTLKSPSGSTPHIMEVCRSFDHIKKIWRAHTARQSQPTHTGHFVIKQYGWFEKKNFLAKESHCRKLTTFRKVASRSTSQLVTCLGL